MKSEKREKRYLAKPMRFTAGMEGNKIRYMFHTPEEGTPYEELFEPKYWAAVRNQVAIGDMIRVVPDEGNYVADLYVASTGIGGVRVREFYKKIWETDYAPEGLMHDYQVKWGGPHHKWRVMRIDDGSVEMAGFTNEADANRWLADNADALAIKRAKEAEKEEA